MWKINVYKAGRRRGRLSRAAAKMRTWLRRPAFLASAGLILFTAALPVIAFNITNNRYELGETSKKLLDPVKPALSEKFTYDAEKKAYYFNKKGLDAAPDIAPAPTNSESGPNPAAALKQMQAQIGAGDKKEDKSLYSVELSEDPKKGITYYDNNLGLSFKMTSTVEQFGPRIVDGRVIYPNKGGTYAVYTAKSNGLKEDIILEQPVGDALDFGYTLQLPKELEARLTDQGGLGIYSADPSFFGSISYGTPDDQARVMAARTDGKKEHLVFAVPAPVIIQSGKSGQGEATAAFQLVDNVLTVKTSGLAKLNYPISIDPSVAITSTSDFDVNGNNDGGIDFQTAGEIRQGNQTGGTLGSFTQQTTQLAQSRSLHTGAVYNGYMYIVGGRDEGSSTDLNTVTYASINPTTGVLGSWTVSPNTFTNARYYHGGAIYNGYLYIVGGRNFAATTFQDVQYAKINADGSVGVWTATTSYTSTAVRALKSFAYDGYLYKSGGFDGTTYYTTVEYAPIRANGTIGTWVSTTGIPTGRYAHTLDFANGYAYIVGGVVAGAATTGTTFYSKVNTDGTLGAWTASTAIPEARYQHSAFIHKGFLYVIGGSSSVSTPVVYQYESKHATINTNGSLGPWTASTNHASGGTIEQTSALALTAYDYVYYVSGRSPSQFHTYTRSAKISPQGVTANFAANTSLASTGGGGANAAARSNHTSVVNNGFIYTIAGFGSAARAHVQYATISPTGVIGTWTLTTAVPTARYNHTSVVYNGYLYVMGGFTGTIALGDVQYALICTASNSGVGGCTGTVGAVGTWASTSAVTVARYDHTSVVYNGYLYIIGGNTGVVGLADVQYALICTGSNNGVGGCGTTAGTVGTWAATSSFTTARFEHTSVASNGFLYVIGGTSGSFLSDVQYALICTGSNNGVGGCTATAGTVGTWATTNSFTSARSAHTSVISNGYLYVIGGFNVSSFADVQYALICTGSNNGVGGCATTAGTVGTWATTTSFPTARYGHTSLVHNGYLLVIGGTNGSNLSDIQNALVSSNGALGTFATTTSFTTGRYGHTSLAHNGYLYVIGGNGSGGFLADIRYALICTGSNNGVGGCTATAGTVGTWATTTSFPTARYYHTSVVSNGYLYVIGGYSPSFLADVQYALICTGSNNGVGGCGTTAGTVGTWAATTSFTTGRHSHTSVVHKGYLYVIGGTSSVSFLADVQYALICTGSNNGVGGCGTTAGTVGTWATTTSFPTARFNHASVVSNGYLYVIGGAGSSNYLTDIQYALICTGSNNGVGGCGTTAGTVGTWAATTSFTTGRNSVASVVFNGYLYVIGGTGSVDHLTDVQYAPINSNGTISSFASTTNFAINRYGHSSVVSNGYLYVLGGDNGASFYSDVQYSLLLGNSRKANYSKLIDLGTTTTISDINFTGTLINGKSDITYKLAGADTIFGSNQSASNLTGVCVGGGTTRYILLSVLLDDSVFGALQTNNMTAVQDITINYSSAAGGGGVLPVERLRGGKLLNETIGLESLDLYKAYPGAPTTCT